MSASSSVPLPAAVSTATKTETVLAVNALKKKTVTIKDQGAHFNKVASLLSGAVAGASSKTCTAPFSRLTILLQVSTASDRPNTGVFRTLSSIYQKEGLASLWRGNCTAVLQKFPAAAMSYWSFETAKIQMRPFWNAPDQPGNAVRFTAGFAAGMAATTVTYPLDLVRTTLAANSDPTSAGYRAGIGGTITNIVRQGGLKSLFRGYGPSVLCQGLNLSLNFGIYESVQSMFFLKKDKKRTGLIGTLAVAPLTGIVASCIVHPLDLLRRRQQMDNSRWVWQVACDIIRKDGPKGLYRGLLPEIIKVAPAVSINFYVYEFVRQEIIGANIAPR